MDRLNYIITKIDTSLKDFYFKDFRFYGLCRQERKNSELLPVAYKGNGEYEVASFNDRNGLMCYHRNISMDERDDKNGGFGTDILKEEIFNNKLIVFGSQKKINNTLVDINYRIADEIKGLIQSVLTRIQLNELDAQSCIIECRRVEYDKQKVFSDELPDTNFNIKPENVLFSIDYSINLRYLQACKVYTCSVDANNDDEACATVAIVNQDGTLIQAVASGGSYTVVQWAGIDEGGSSTTYSNGITDQ